MVVVLSNGAVDKHTVEFDVDVDDSVLAAAGGWLAQRLTGESLAAAGRAASELEARPASAGGDALVAVLSVALAVLVDDHSKADHVYIGGTSRMASAFDAVDTVSEVLRILEQQYVVVSLLHDVIDRGLQVAIGAETGMAPLADCSVVVVALRGRR